jgi:hypothetical protein
MPVYYCARIKSDLKSKFYGRLLWRVLQFLPICEVAVQIVLVHKKPKHTQTRRGGGGAPERESGSKGERSSW